MKNNDITYLYQKGYFSDIDVAFAGFIRRLSGEDDPDTALAAALCSRATGNAHACLDLCSVAGSALTDAFGEAFPVICPELALWRKKLLALPQVGHPGEFAPLILDDANRLYLFRYWEYETRLCRQIVNRNRADAGPVDAARVRESVGRLFPEGISGGINQQKVAAAVSVLKRFCVISGGPGTGKTTTVARILAVLQEQAGPDPLRILLCAPTGKAASRLSESIRSVKDTLDCSRLVRDVIPDEASTIHRMLGVIAGSPYFRHNSDRMLPADVVVVDEASMVDLALMAKMIDAISPKARLILLGDKDQLASVEVGSVFGDICGNTQTTSFSESFGARVGELTGETPPVTGDAGKACETTGLQDNIVVLEKNYRFSAAAGIGAISGFIKSGRRDAVAELLTSGDAPDVIWKSMGSEAELTSALSSAVLEGYRKYLQCSDPAEALQNFRRFRVLCALKEGPFGVSTVNRLIEKILGRHGLIQQPDHQPDRLWYPGRPVMITVNDYHLELYNGDIGIAMADPGSSGDDVYVYFSGPDGHVRRFAPFRLPAHETAFSMTVHKSQGSEFDHVVLVIPDRDCPVLTRELIYTGITRAVRSVEVWGRERIIGAAVSRGIVRTSGLRDALWTDSPGCEAPSAP